LLPPPPSLLLPPPEDPSDFVAYATILIEVLALKIPADTKQNIIAKTKNSTKKL
jgi:hypothetical protein